jgi:hypothetical protein
MPGRPIARVDKSRDLSWRSAFMFELDLMIAQLFGESPLAEQMRNKGVYNALAEADYEINEDLHVNTEILYRDASLEKSKTSEYLLALRDALAQKDDASLPLLERKLRHHSEELNMIVETMADTVSLFALKDYLNNFPGKELDQNLLSSYFERIKSDYVRRGQIGNLYIKVCLNSKNTGKREKLLADAGIRYSQVLVRSNEEDNLSANLVKLGYDPINSLKAYEDMNLLKSRASAAGMAFEDLLLPMNSAKASIWMKYNGHITEFMDLVDRKGKEGYQIMLNAESIYEITDMPAKNT